jgi:hypothetical protein
LLTYVENNSFSRRPNTPGDDPGALINLTTPGPWVPLAALSASPRRLLDSIDRKYVALFQNIGRTTIIGEPVCRRWCRSPPPIQQQIPGLFTASGDANPNIPPPSTQLSTNGWNANDPACP